MKTNLIFLATFIYIFSIKSTNGQGELNLYGNLEFGSYNVGFKKLAFSNSSGQASQNIQIQLWYPAKGKISKMKFEDYLCYKEALSQEELLRSVSIGISGKENSFSEDTLSIILNSPMRAGKEAKIMKGRFPLLIWSARYGTVEYQNIFSEYLASHGYVVAFAEDVPNAPFPWQIQSNEEKVSILNQHVRDINSAISYLKQQPNVDTTRLGLLSWSYAGESAILTQIRNQEIDLVVGLSSIGFTSGLYLGATLETEATPDKLTVPYLIQSQRTRGNGTVINPPLIFDSMHSQSRYISYEQLAHGSFNVMEGMLPGILRTEKVQGWSKGGEVAQLGFEAICKMTLSFLNAIFNEKSFNEKVIDIQKDLPEGFFSVTAPLN